MKKIGVRQARIFLAVANAASVTGAAKVVNRSQTSVTKSIQDLRFRGASQAGSSDARQVITSSAAAGQPGAATMLTRAYSGQFEIQENGWI